MILYVVEYLQENNFSRRIYPFFKVSPICPWMELELITVY